MIKINELVEKAKKANSQEMLAPVFKNQDFEVWVGVWLTENGDSDIFTAVSIQLGFSDDCSVNMNYLQNAVDVTGKLHELGFTVYHCNSSIYMERESGKEEVNEHLKELGELLAVDLSNIIIIRNEKEVR